MQGYYFSPAIHGAEVAKMVRARVKASANAA
jgi:hypothetical protein